MATASLQATLQVTGVVVSIPDRSGGAIAGTSTWSLLLAISTPGGEPVTGLAASRFAVAAVVVRRGTATAVPLEIAAVLEPMPGVYGLSLAGGTADRLVATRAACVVDVSTEDSNSTSRGRALIELGA